MASHSREYNTEVQQHSGACLCVCLSSLHLNGPAEGGRSCRVASPRNRMANDNQLVLKALKYNQGDVITSEADVSNQKFRQLVSWIEDTKIRLYKVEERESLRKIADDAWNQTFEKYLEALECPYSSTDARVLNWLLNYALSLEYRDNEAKLNALELEDLPEPKLAMPSADEPPFEDVGSMGSNTLVHEVASMLNVPQEGYDEVGLLQKLEQIVAARTKALSQAATSEVTTKNMPLGFSTGDAKVDAAALVLRSLYIQDLRKLQSTIDETTVNLQEFTANPKTDSKLGRVGR